MATISVTDDNFDTDVKAGKPVIVDFWAEYFDSPLFFQVDYRETEDLVR